MPTPTRPQRKKSDSAGKSKKKASAARAPSRRRKQATKGVEQLTKDVLCSMVLDMSGSMSGVQLPVIEGVNDYIEGLRSDEQGEVLFSLTAFDTIFEHWYVGVPLADVRPISTGNYVPRGMTALNDAIAHSILEIEKKLKKLGREDMRVLHVTITDGAENSSQDYPNDSLGKCDRLIELVKAKEATGQWTFVYLGAGHASRADAQRVASGIGYRGENSMLYSNTRSGVAAASAALASATSTLTSSDKASSKNFFGDAGQDEADYVDPSAANPSQVVVTSPNMNTASGVLDKSDLFTALGGVSASADDMPKRRRR